MKRLLYFSPFSEGGLADYAHEQAEALTGMGVNVTMLTVPEFKRERSGRYALAADLAAPKTSSGRSRIASRLHTSKTILKNMDRLYRHILSEGHTHVLMGCYSEYLAPFWAGRLKRLAEKRGVVFGSIVHDPVRDYVVGPLWWHHRSVAAGYSFLREAFVHEEIILNTRRPMPRLRTTVIPHGPLPFPPPTLSREAMRERLRLPKDAVVLLAFGYLRDNKNLDLVLKAMKAIPGVYLVVAGREQSAGQKDFAHYVRMAGKLGVEERCRWEHRFIDRSDVGNWFEAADYAVLTYAASFHSASGVLNAAAWFQKPCIASSGSGNLRTVVQRYHLGWWAEPDHPASLHEAIQNAVASPIRPDWNSYKKENSWSRNTLLIAEKMFDQYS